MKNDINHSDYKSFIMQNLDGILSEVQENELNKHMKTCKECMEYSTDMKTIKDGITSYIIEAPDYLETRVMASIKSAKPAFNFRPVVNFGISFAAIMVLAVFVMNKPFGSNTNIAINTSGVNTAAVSKDIAKKADSTSVKQVIAKQEPKAIVPQEKQVVVAEQKQMRVYAPAYAPAVKKDETTAAKSSVSETVVQYSQVSVAEVKTPEAGIPEILDRDKATVGNNMIDPTRGECAVIRAKVEEASRVRVVIYDETVKPVVLIVDGDKSPGVYEWKWYGRNDTNSVVSEGVYYVYIQIGKTVVKRPVVIKR